MLDCHSVYLSVGNITQKAMDGLQWKFMEGSRVVKGTSTLKGTD